MAKYHTYHNNQNPMLVWVQQHQWNVPGDIVDNIHASVHNSCCGKPTKSREIIFSWFSFYIYLHSVTVSVKSLCCSAWFHNSYFPLSGIWIYIKKLLPFLGESTDIYIKTLLPFLVESTKNILTPHQAFHGEAALHSALLARTPD